MPNFRLRGAFPPLLRKKLSEAIAPGAEHLLIYHLLLEGSALVELLDGQSTELTVGDIVIFAHGDAHHMSRREGSYAAVPELRD